MFKNRIIYIFIVIFMGFYALLYDEYFTGVLFLVTLIMPIILLCLLIIMKSKIHVEFEVDSNVIEKGEPRLLSIRINNRSILPVSKIKLILFYYNEYTGVRKKEFLSTFVDGNNTQVVNFRITAHNCGFVTFQIDKFHIYDYFNIWTLSKKVRQRIKVAVLPKTHELPFDLVIDNNYLPIDNSDTYSLQKKGDDPSQVFDIREFREGDKLQRIHWKLSSKHEEWMTKEFSDPINSKIVIILELYCGQISVNHQEYVDGLLECVLSLSDSLITNMHGHHMIWYDSGVDDIKDLYILEQEDIYSVLELLYNTKVMGSKDSILNVFNETTRNEYYSHMFYITTIISEDIIDKLANERNGTIIYILYINDFTSHPVPMEIITLAKSKGVAFIEIELSRIRDSLLSINLQ